MKEEYQTRSQESNLTKYLAEHESMNNCLKEPEALYDFITGSQKPVPVSSEDSTSQQE